MELTKAQANALRIYADAGSDYGKQMLACISVKWHAKVAGSLEKKRYLERHDAPNSGMFRITPLGRFYASLLTAPSKSEGE